MRDLTARLFEDLEEIRGKYDDTDLAEIRRHAGMILMGVETDVLRRIADARDRVADTPSVPGLGLLGNEDDQAAIIELIELCWSIDGSVTDEDEDEEPDEPWRAAE